MEENWKPTKEEDQPEDNKEQVNSLGQWEGGLFSILEDDLEKKEKKKKLAAKQKRLANIFKKVVPKIELNEVKPDFEVSSEISAEIDSTDQPQIIVLEEVVTIKDALVTHTVENEYTEQNVKETEPSAVHILQIDRDDRSIHGPATAAEEYTVLASTLPVEATNDSLDLNGPSIFAKKSFVQSIVEKIPQKKEQKPKPKKQSVFAKLFFGNKKKNTPEKLPRTEFERPITQKSKNISEISSHRAEKEKIRPKYYEKIRPSRVGPEDSIGANTSQKYSRSVEYREPTAKYRELRHESIDEDFAKGATPIGAFFQNSAMNNKDNDLAQLASAKSLLQVIAKQKSLEKAQKELYPKAIKGGVLGATIVLVACFLVYLLNSFL